MVCSAAVEVICLVWCILLQRVAVCWIICLATVELISLVCCSVLQHVAACCSVLQRVAACRSVFSGHSGSDTCMYDLIKISCNSALTNKFQTHTSTGSLPVTVAMVVDVHIPCM